MKDMLGRNALITVHDAQQKLITSIAQIKLPPETVPRITSYNVCYTKLLRNSIANNRIDIKTPFHVQLIKNSPHGVTFEKL